MFLARQDKKTNQDSKSTKNLIYSKTFNNTSKNYHKTNENK